MKTQVIKIIYKINTVQCRCILNSKHPPTGTQVMYVGKWTMREKHIHTVSTRALKTPSPWKQQPPSLGKLYNPLSRKTLLSPECRPRLPWTSNGTCGSQYCSANKRIKVSFCANLSKGHQLVNCSQTNKIKTMPGLCSKYALTVLTRYTLYAELKNILSQYS